MLIALNLEDFDRFVGGAGGEASAIVVENGVVLLISRLADLNFQAHCRADTYYHIIVA